MYLSRSLPFFWEDRRIKIGPVVEEPEIGRGAVFSQ